MAAATVVAMRLSIIIPTRNEHATLWFTLQGLLAQLRMHDGSVEIIVADNEKKLNPKGAMKIVGDLHDARVRYVHAGAIQSPYYPRDVGAEAATGEWICFLDSHVLMAENWLDVVIDGIHRGYPKDAIVHYPVSFNDPKIRWGHYKLRLDTDFWGSWGPRAKGTNHIPYRIAATGIWAMTMTRSWYVDTLRGFNTEFRGYSGGEPYLDLKSWCMGGQVLMDPCTGGSHYSGPRGYKAGWIERIRNFAIAIEVIDPSRLGTFTAHYMAKVGGPKVKVAVSEGVAAAQKEAAWFNEHRKLSLPQLLEYFEAKGVPH
jgi:glycosyltransferase involved in cell wall biosynthesis